MYTCIYSIYISLYIVTNYSVITNVADRHTIIARRSMKNLHKVSEKQYAIVDNQYTIMSYIIIKKNN